MISPTARPVKDEMHALPELNPLDDGSAFLRWMIQHAIPAASVATDRMA
jgi:hypothetical protein